jgi:hypothetical protein
VTRTLAGFAGLIVALAVLQAAMLHWGWPVIEPMLMAPRVAFAAQPPLDHAAYDQPAMWLARPDLRDDPARYLPPGTGHARRGGAYVFFLHPTTYMGRNHWNAPLDHADSRMRAALAVQSMASVFNDQAAIYAPRYRQAALGTFLIDSDDSQRALALAEGDARAAFAAFVRQVPATAPIVLAGHSQGALITLHLLRDGVRGTPLAARVVAVYLGGWPVSPRHDLPMTGMPACSAAIVVGCVMAWMSFAERADPRQVQMLRARYPALDGQRGDDAPLCTNPLTGGATPDASPAANLGSLLTGNEFNAAAMAPRSVGARCDRASGLLMISNPPHLGDGILSGNNYTTYDYALFWANLRADIARREAAWQANWHEGRAPA